MCKISPLDGDSIAANNKENNKQKLQEKTMGNKATLSTNRRNNITFLMNGSIPAPHNSQTQSNNTIKENTHVQYGERR